jgi:hypothetical protein
VMNRTINAELRCFHGLGKTGHCGVQKWAVTEGSA